MRHRLASLVLICALPASVSGCSFDASGLSSDGPGSPDARPAPDAPPPPDALPPDASGPCGGAPLTLSLSIDGVSAAPADGEPFTNVLVGDLVEISAEGSCSADDALTYAWEITPGDDIETTAEPDLRSETLTVYPSSTGDYMVELTITNGSGAQLGSTVLGFRVHGWTVAATPTEMDDVRDLTPGAGNLWIASAGGAYRLPLDGDADAFTLVNDGISGDAISNGLAAVFFDGVDQVWFGRQNNDSIAWRVTLAADTMTSTQVAYEDAVGGDARIHDFALAENDAIAAATNRGLTQVEAGASSFTGNELPDGEEVFALATGAGRRMAGSGKSLHDLASGDTLDAVPDDDDDILALALDTDREILWAGTGGLGIAEFDLVTNSSVRVYDTEDSGLGSNEVRALAVEAQGKHAGDVWAATNAGIARYISRRQTWVHLDADHGLSGEHSKVQAIAVDVDPDSGRRTIYAGTLDGLVYSRPQ